MSWLSVIGRASRAQVSAAVEVDAAIADLQRASKLAGDELGALKAAVDEVSRAGKFDLKFTVCPRDYIL